MVSRNNVFCATNPARMMDALCRIIDDSNVALDDILIFVPSRRAVRGIEKMLVDRAGHAVILPRIVALGEGADDFEFVEFDDENGSDNIISNTERVIILAKLLSADAAIGNISTALPVARDLVRMSDYLENEGVDVSTVDWASVVDSRYAAHFQHKAQILQIVSDFMSEYANGRVTATEMRNAGIRAWINVLDKYKLVIVCASTASVPATADLMTAVAMRDNGRIILPGKIAGRVVDFELKTNPYNAEYRFLSRLGMGADDVIKIDVGPSAIDFMNNAFGNTGVRDIDGDAVNHCHLIVCNREATEATVAIEIAMRAVKENKSVLIITPDAAGNQRLANAARVAGLSADFSGGVSGTMTVVGRAILNAFDDWIEREDSMFDKLYLQNDYDLMKTIIAMVDDKVVNFAPEFDVSDSENVPIWNVLFELSNCVSRAGLRLGIADAWALVADALSGVSVRQPMNADADVVVIGTIESRMQTADVIILTGLNDGMFPARGYENAWLPTRVADDIGLPSPDRKVSLMSLDFMNLSCGAEVFWLRSRVAGGTQTTESRFISRVSAVGGAFDVARPVKKPEIDYNIHTGIVEDILSAVAMRDDVPARPLDCSAPQLDVPDWSDVYVTRLELLIHNPYVFYATHLLKLRPKTDYWMPPDMRDFGTLVHDIMEHISPDMTATDLVAQMDARARKKLGKGSVLFHFWHKHFVEIADYVAPRLPELAQMPAEINGMVEILGRRIRARADRIWDGGVMDIKTGVLPTKKQLLEGNMPQLPLEAYMLQNGGFHIKTTEKSKTPVIQFLQLKGGKVDTVQYDIPTTQKMINRAVSKVEELVQRYSCGNALYEYRTQNDRKYRAYDDLARAND